MKRILLVRTDRVGDVVTITPVIRELRKQFPDSFIGTLTQPHTKAVLLNNPYINVMLEDTLSKNSFSKVVKEIRRYKFTDALLMIPTERAAYQLFLAGIKNRIGVGKKLYEVITFMKSVSRNKYIPVRHEADYNMDLARKLGVVSNDLKPEIFLTPEERTEGQEILQKYADSKNALKIILHTGSGNSAPNWSEDNYLRLIKLLLERFHDNNICIFLTAREMTGEFLFNIENLNHHRIFNISNDVSDLRTFIKVISATDIVIGSSTGPMHLADALGIKSIVLHCNRSMSCAKRWGMQNPTSVNLEVSSEFCQNNCSEDKEDCRIETGIIPETVIESVDAMIRK